MLKYLILLTIFVSCGPDKIQIRKKTDPVFIAYIRYFENTYGARILTPITFKTLGGTLAGQCIKTNTKSEIVIDDLKWEDFNEGQKEVLILHEIGHCVLNRKHDINTNVINGTLCPTSVMRTPLYDKVEIANCYTPNRDYYLQELFN